MAEDIEVLERAISEERASVVLDFSALHAVDEEALRAIARLIDDGNPMVAASSSLRLRLRRHRGRQPGMDE